MTRPAGRRSVSARLPDFPWDRLASARARAVEHQDGLVDLSMGTPVDPTPEVVRAALAAGANAPGYPQTVGTAELRHAVADWLRRRFEVALSPDGVLPSIGLKELVGSLAVHLGLGPDDVVVVPELAYPTYEVGARLAGCEVVAADSLTALGPRRPALLWVNSPSNPTGRVLPAAHLAKAVAWARERGALLVSDECYLELGWAESDADQPVSVLHPDVCEGSYDGVLALHSLSKRSSMAGYRVGFVAGDAAVVAELLAVRRNLGLMMPAPVQRAAVVALGDDGHVDDVRARYAGRRAVLWPALEAAGFRIDHSEAGLYLWATRGEPCADTVAWFAERGVLVAPGDFYGPGGAQHVRLALTATDERISAAAARLTARLP